MTSDSGRMRLREAEPDSSDPIASFIARWAQSSAAERANFQSFAVELCDVLNVDRPGPATGDPARDRYRFEYPVRFAHPDGATSTGSIDLYRRDAFVMEAKQGSDQQLEEQLALFGGVETQTRKGAAVRGTRNWSIAMQGARGQAERYAKALPVDHGWPPFLIIVDGRRPLLRALCRLQPDRQELQPVPGRPEFPHRTRRSPRPDDP